MRIPKANSRETLSDRSPNGTEHRRKATTDTSYHHIADLMLRPFIKSPARLSALLSFLIIGAFISTRLLDIAINFDPAIERVNIRMKTHLNCTDYNNLNRKCPSSTNLPQQDLTLDPTPTCPHYFNWIHEDLKPWAQSGITREMVESAKKTANFRLVILDGRAYVETYEKGFQSRDTFNLWGFLQLLRWYPGKIPDVDIMFDCVDWPVVLSKDYPEVNDTSPPPLFRYCADNATMDIVFPDWSFWGWPEINIKPWEALLEELREGNRISKWEDREPFAFWKGNPNVSENRQELLTCNVSKKGDWNARIFIQDWKKEQKQGFKQSNLASQCKHRYKIYIEGSAWSVSEKYILACDSVTLLVKPRYYDFFTRSLIPLYHYWPIHDEETCKSIKFAVDWGNSHGAKAQELGKAASKFIQEDLKMEFVYDYMFHLLCEYAKLLKYKPTVPENAVEYCLESMACNSTGLTKKFMMESMVTMPSSRDPCDLPQYEPASLERFNLKKESSIRKIETWERNKFGTVHFNKTVRSSSNTWGPVGPMAPSENLPPNRK